jgi:hypothetical protein
MKLKVLLLATTNDNKITRIKKLLKDVDINILTLNDLSFSIEEPEEFGKDAMEIAMNKAKYYWEKTQHQYPVLTQDDTMDFLGNVIPEDDPSTSIKSPVVKAYGEFNTENAITYYSKLSEKYGGAVDFAFRYGHGYADTEVVKGTTSSLYAKLVKEPKGIDQVGKYPLRALTKIKVGETFVYSADATEEEKVLADYDIKRALLELLS